jgi:hypothetical protein
MSVLSMERYQKHSGADSRTFNSLIHHHHTNNKTNNNTSLHKPHRRLSFHQPSRRHRTRWLTWLAPIRQSHHYRNPKVLGSVPIKTRKTERNDKRAELKKKRQVERREKKSGKPS